MKVKIMKNNDLTYGQWMALCRDAAIAACTALENEGYYTPENNEVLWETAWNAAYNAYVCEGVDKAEGVYLATEAARRHAKAIPGGMTRYKHIKAGKITPAWLLAQ